MLNFILFVDDFFEFEVEMLNFQGQALLLFAQSLNLIFILYGYLAPLLFLHLIFSLQFNQSLVLLLNSFAFAAEVFCVFVGDFSRLFERIR